jgi:hypothetical protein
MNSSHAANRKKGAHPGTLIGTVAMTVLGVPSICGQPFSPVTTPLQPLVHAGVAWADYDRDGQLDFVVAGSTSPLAGGAGFTGLYRNLGNGAFALVDANLPVATFGSVAWGDYDNDQDVDLLVTGYGGGAGRMTTILRNDGGGQFTDIAPAIVAVGHGNAAWGDFDNDGRLDVGVCGVPTEGGSLTRIYRNLGGGNFVDIQAGLPGPANFNGSLSWVDFDQDADLDLLLLGGQFTRIYRNDGGRFVNAELGLPAAVWGAAAWGDVDNDGDQDLALTGIGAGDIYRTRIFGNNGNGTFDDLNVGLPGAANSHIAFGDFNRDGRSDVLLTGRGDGSAGAVTGIYFNSATGPYSPFNAGLADMDTAEGAGGDFDGDGDLDVLVSGWLINTFNGDTRLYRNQSSATNLAPQPPTALVAVVSEEETVTLSWARPTENGIPNLGLSYSLRVGTTPGSSDILAPESEPTTGRRQVAAPGRVTANRWVLRNLPRRTYYWSVQSVDAAFVGSPFAAEQSFVVTGTRPGISSIADQAGFPDTTFTIPFVVSDDVTPAANLIVSAVSTNETLIGPGQFSFSGTGPSRVLTVTPLPGQRGTSAITVTVRDGQGQTNSTTFQMAVEEFTRTEVAFPAWLQTSGAAWGDYDNDGDLDFIVGGEYSSAPYTLLYRNDAPGRFQNIVTSVTPVSYTEPVWGDYDNDGFLDLFISGYDNTASVAHVYHNDRTGTFTRAFQLNGALWGGADWGDYDNDGDLDLIYSGSGASRFYRNAGGTNFTSVPTTLPGLGWSGLAGGDIDNDSDRDLVMGGAEIPARIIRNDLSQFVEVTNGIPSQPYGSFDWGDYDQDGDLDLAVCGTVISRSARIFRNEAGEFVDIAAPLPSTQQGTVAWGDYDNDGDLDLLLTGYEGSPAVTVVYRNDHGTFADSGAVLPGAYDSTAVWGDYDNDGDLDILLAGTTCAVLRNNSRRANTLPTVPSGLGATLLAENGVRLNWTPSTDAETPSAGLHYNLRVGTTPGGQEIMTPQANLGTGWRRVALRGNGNATTQWRLLDLPRGTYYWSVQSIDPTFAASSFAAEGSFTITNARPTLSPIADQITAPSVALPVIPITVSDDESAGSALLVTVSSSNANLLRIAGVVVSGSGDHRTLTLLPEPHQFGVTTITITVTDPQGLSATRSFTLSVPLFADTQIPLVAVNTLNGAYATWADYDNDDDLDLLLGGYTGSAVARIYRNNGTGGLNNPIDPITPVYGDTATGDFDNDGDLDIFAMGLSLLGGGRSATLYQNNGSGGFTAVAGNFIGTFRGMPAWGDYDNDGRLDLMLCGSESTGFYLRIYRNNGTTFSLAATFPTFEDAAIAWGDYDDDRDLDILSAQPGASRVYRNDGAAGFGDAVPNLPGVSSGSAAWIDFNQDGRLDFILAGISTNVLDGGAITRLFRNQGNGTFAVTPAAFHGVSHGALAWGDFDNDGSPDLLLTGAGNGGSDVSKLYLNTGGAFNEAPITLPAVSNSLLAAADYDRDGDLDVLMGGRSNSVTITRLFRNNSSRPNAAPAAPGALSATVLPDNDVRLDWGPGTDDRTSASGLRANLRVGTTMGAGDVVAPHAHGTTGNRRIAEIVASGHGRSWHLRDLPKGNYYWSVQSIDAGLAGSSFAPTMGFSITNARPTISAVSNLLTGPNRMTTPVLVTIGDLETSADGLTFSGQSSDQSLIPNANILLGGSGSNRTVALLPANSLSGSAAITLTVTDASGAQRSTTFLVYVEPLILSTDFPAQNARHAAWGDYDNDGDLDLLLVGTAFGLGPARILRNQSGAFAPVTTGIESFQGALGAWGDYDRDGYLDLLLTGYGRGALFRNLGDGTFTEIPAGLTNATAGIASWADYDNDGDLDILLSTYTRSESLILQLFRNEGAHQFVKVAANLPAVDSGSVAWGDYDRDGDLDLLLSGRERSQQAIAGVYRNDGSGGSFPKVADLPPVVGGTAWGDFDNDGDLDVLLAGRSESPSETNRVVYRNDDGVFAGLTGLPELNQGSGAWGDFDNDGRLDLALSGLPMNSQTTRTIVFRNRGDGEFEAGNTQFQGTRSLASAWGDFDRDGDLDLILAGSETRLVRNESFRPNTRPTPPESLSATLSPDGWLTLSWEPGSDAQTPTAGLHYNLRLGHAAGGQQVVSPEADLLTGQRRVSQRGNAGPMTSWRLRLPPGTYFWSVQAIDSAFAASAFSAESIFTVANARLTILPPVAGQVPLLLQGEPFRSYAIEGSDDLQTWTELAMQTVGEDGSASFSIAVTGAQRRFFRPRPLP